jgi:hypothetical protein
MLLSAPHVNASSGVVQLSPVALSSDVTGAGRT